MQETISIAIPTYEMNGMGAETLVSALNGVRKQSHPAIEVVVSDHSVNDEIKNLCDAYRGTHLPGRTPLNIVYIRNEDRRGNFAANLNHAIKNCSGKIIKLLMMDDFLVDPEALDKISARFIQNPELTWLANGCLSGFFGERTASMNPTYDIDKIVSGINTIGSPSVLTIKNENVELFNEDLHWVVDLDYYIRVQKKFGDPCFLNENLVFVLRHPNQLSETLSGDIKKKEQEWLEQTYKK